MAQTHIMLYLSRSFPAKEPCINGSFVRRDLQLKASYVFSPPRRYSHATRRCIHTETHIQVHVRKNAYKLCLAHSHKNCCVFWFRYRICIGHQHTTHTHTHTPRTQTNIRSHKHKPVCARTHTHTYTQKHKHMH